MGTRRWFRKRLRNRLVAMWPIVPNASLAGVAVLWFPARGAFGDQVEDVPHSAEIVAGRERGVGDAHDLVPCPLEHRDAGHCMTVAPVPHVLREGRALD